MVILEEKMREIEFIEKLYRKIGIRSRKNLNF